MIYDLSLFEKKAQEEEDFEETNFFFQIQLFSE